jgi:hypothetical protein
MANDGPQPGDSTMSPELAQKDNAARAMQKAAQQAADLVKDAGVDPDYIKVMEPFLTMKHPDIMNGLQAMNAGAMHAKAQAWQNLADETVFNSMGLTAKVQRTLAGGAWEGATADAIQAATRRFADQINDMHDVTQSVASRIQAAAFGADVVRAMVPPIPAAPPAEGPPGAEDPVAAIMHTLATSEAEQAAQHAMNDHYKPTYQPAGEQVPRYVPPTGPDDGANPGSTTTIGPGSTTNPGSTTTYPGSTTSPGSPGNQPGDSTSKDSSQNNDGQPGDQNRNSPGSPANSTTTQGNSTQSPSNPTSTTPTGVNPTATTPAGLDPGSTTPGATVPGGPGSGIPGVTTGGAPGPGGPGRSVPGGTAPGTGTPAGGPGGAKPAAAGMPGMPGMGMPGSRGKGEDDKEHKTRPELSLPHQNKIDLMGEPVFTPPPVYGENPPPSGDRRQGGEPDGGKDGRRR